MTASEVRRALCAVANDKSAAITTILNGIAGGWEIWLQVELALQLLANASGHATREVPYPSGQKSDFMIVPRAGLPIWVELKTQVNAEDTTVTTRFKADIAKIDGQSPQWIAQNIAVALAYALPKTKAQADLIEVLCRPGARISVWQLVLRNWQSWSPGGAALALEAPTVIYYSQSTT
ncbi:hypothetical protein [Rhodoferax sp. GW822-FHT02A01]|uniref:hypothetical protein n=1 Tax=Rhodoferax sp. GW822-FHT02A01 TaxID=3141537 RepID=UPI00315D5BA6